MATSLLTGVTKLSETLGGQHGHLAAGRVPPAQTSAEACTCTHAHRTAEVLHTFTDPHTAGLLKSHSKAGEGACRFCFNT